MSREAAERDSRGNIVIMHKHRKLEGSLGVEIVQELLPGIPDHIIICVVAPKLPVAALCKLSAVSRGWQRAIQSRQVYDARVRSQSTQTVVVMNHNLAIGDRANAPALYSVSDNSFCQLPQFPILGLYPSGELPWGCQCISLDGKVYVLGGLFPETGFGESRQSSAAVYVLDLAGQRKWKQCASMRDPRSEFGCGVINGKIYVFGGSRATTIDLLLHNVVYGSEVYDPKSDSWSPIAPKIYHAIRSHVKTVGEELFVYGGGVVDENHSQQLDNLDDVRRATPFLDRKVNRFAEVYHPLKNQWRIVNHFREHNDDYYTKLVVAGGKLLRFSLDNGIDMYDTSENSWKRSQALSLREFVRTGPDPSVEMYLDAAVAVDDELLALVHWIKFHDPNYETYEQGLWLLRSHGLGSQNRQIVWHRVGRPLPSHEFPGALCTTQL